MVLTNNIVSTSIENAPYKYLGTLPNNILVTLVYWRPASKGCAVKPQSQISKGTLVPDAAGSSLSLWLPCWHGLLPKLETPVSVAFSVLVSTHASYAQNADLNPAQTG